LGDLTAVDNLDFVAGAPAEFWDSWAPNGAGKTTSLRILLGLYAPDAGVVRVLGRRVGEARSRIGYLPKSAASTNACAPTDADRRTSRP